MAAIRHIGLFGGTFDPVHSGHLILAEYVRSQCQLDEIIFIPAQIHPLKDNQTISEVTHRLQMLQLATSDNPHFSISEIELRSQKTSYTIDTIRALKAEMPDDHQLYFLLGTDNVEQFHLWHRPQELLKLCNFLTFGRIGSQDVLAESPYRDYFRLIETPLIEISATDIRRRFGLGHSCRYLLPEKVRQYILQHGLYLQHSGQND